MNDIEEIKKAIASIPSGHRWSVNQDCCPLCGMSGLQMLQRGGISRHQEDCSLERRAAFAKQQGWNEWLIEARFYL